MSKFQLIDNLLGDKRISESFFIKNDMQLYKEILFYCNNIPDLSFKEKLWHWVNDYPNMYLCKCGEKTTFNKNWRDGYRKYCSSKCLSNDSEIKEKRKKTCLQKWGCESNLQSVESKEKIIKTNLERYGFEYAQQSELIKEKSKQTNLERYGVENPILLDEFKEKVKKSNLNKFGVEYAQQSDFIKEKAKKTNLKKYGVENPMQNEEVKEKAKKTNLEKYGFEYAQQSESIKEKAKKTNLEKYGVDNPMFLEEFKERVKKTNLEKYGVDNPMFLEEFKEKIKQTNLDRYGVENPMLLEGFKEKIKITNLERYGMEYTLLLEEVKEKTKKTNLEKYGVENPFQSSEIRSRINKIINSDNYRKSKFKIAKDPNYVKYIKGNLSLFNCTQGHNFELNTDNYYARKFNNIPLCTVCNPISDSISIKEKELYRFIKSIYDGETIQSYRDKIEIDIYLPELKIGFEFNGLYWHSDKYKDKNFHINKTKYFNEKGIRVTHIWEDDWIYRTEIIKSQIKNQFGLSNKIWARKCRVKEVDVKECRFFLDENHIQGFANSNIKLGLYYGEELVSLMTFDKFEGRKKLTKDEYNLNRFCNKIDYSVVGGASKLLNHFVNHYNPSRIVSYADRDWSIGGLYEKLGFKKLYEGDIDYKYVVNDKRIHKSNFKKSKTGVSESKLTIPKIWDCGKIKWEKTF